MIFFVRILITPHKTFDFGFIFLAFEYAKTPARANAVPASTSQSQWDYPPRLNKKRQSQVIRIVTKKLDNVHKGQ